MLHAWSLLWNVTGLLCYRSVVCLSVCPCIVCLCDGGSLVLFLACNKGVSRFVMADENNVAESEFWTLNVRN